MNIELLKKIHSPDDLRSLSLEQMESLSGELRERIIGTVSANGGHLAPNLGVVELTLALHRVFHAPKDKIIWDVGHQTYPHKLLTGRADRFGSVRQYGGLSGFTSRTESEYDCFGAGHAGTAISAAMGFEVAAELSGEEENVVAVVGDGALICGLSMEALNNLRSTCRNLIIVVNDNEMSIAKSIGAIPNYLNRIITGRNYNRFKAFAKMMVGKIPRGEEIIGNIQNLESSAKSLFVPGVFFEELGIRYIGPIDGHRLPDLIQTFERVKEFHRPVLVHIITEKGHGCDYAQAEPARFHGTGRFDPGTGRPLNPPPPGGTFSNAFGKALMSATENDPRIVAVAAAMSAGCGITAAYETRFRDRFFDVGIAEEHALVFAAGMAAGGLRPVVALYATFLQRALDCLFHDICLQNLPVIICADRAGIVEDGPTHHGIYDVSFLRALPHLGILSPRNEAELPMLFDAVLAQKSPAVIRYPRGNSGAPDTEGAPSPVVWGRAEPLRPGSAATLWAVGREVYTAERAADLLEARTGLRIGIVNTRFLKPFDTELFIQEAKQTGAVITLEDHVKTGGLASIAAETLSAHGIAAKLLSFGWEADRVVSFGSAAKLREEGGLTADALATAIAQFLQS